MASERGNVLFIILIAVFLFAALSYAVTRSSGSGGDDASREEAALGAARLVQYATNVALAVQRMQFINHIEDKYLDLRGGQITYGGAPMAEDNWLCTSDECQVFNPAGGGVSYADFEKLSVIPTGWDPTWIHPGHVYGMVANIENLGSDLPEILLKVEAIAPDICKEINRSMGLPEEPQFSTIGETSYQFSGNPSAALAANDAFRFGDDFDDLKGQSDFCLMAGSEYGNYWHVIAVR